VAAAAPPISTGRTRPIDAFAAFGNHDSFRPTGLSKPAKTVKRGSSALNATGATARAHATIIAVRQRRDRNRPSGKIHPTAPSPTISGIQSHSWSHAA
jgi:hypothetical protein